jgi:hypothetical protein
MSITGQGGSLIGWFKRFFVATLMTFGGLQVYGLWIRHFDALVSLFRGYLDTHWTGNSDGAGLFLQVVQMLSGANVLWVGMFALITLVVLVILWFLIGGVRKAELMLSLIIAPVVWPLYLIQSVEDIPKTAFRGFLGLNALLLFSVAMVRMAIRLAFLPGNLISIWNLVPSLALLVMTIFLPATIKRIVGQGQPGVGALVTAVQMAAGLKFLTLGGLGAAGAGAAAPPAAASIPQAPSGPSAYPLAAVQPSGMAGYQGTGAGGASPQARGQAVRAFVEGSAAAAPMGLPEPIPDSELCIDIHESDPGSGQFDTLGAFWRFQQGAQHVHSRPKEDAPEPGGEG